jgi:glycosyltransferase involved in cell wall biosynthesis
VVCADATALPEVAGPAALLVSPRDPEAMAAALLQVLTDGDLAAGLRRKATMEQARRFTSQRMAEEIQQAYRIAHCGVLT